MRQIISYNSLNNNYYGIKEKISQLPHISFPHAGSWFGLPDFGITEAIGGAMGKPATSQGGSNVIGPMPKASTGQVLNNNTVDQNFIGPPNPGQTVNQTYGSTGANLTVPPPQYSGGGGDSGARQGGYQDQAAYDLAMARQREQENMNAEIENAFNAQMGFLNQAQGNLQNNFGSTTQGIESQYGESKNVLDVNKQSNLRDIETQQQGGEQRKEDAVTAARRLYNDLITGGQQRFGGASSASEAYQALTGRELQRNNQQIQTNYAGFMQQIEGAKTTLNERYTLGLQSLEGQKTRALDSARQQFNNALLEIDKLRASAQSEKANRRLQALQDLRNQTFQIQMAEAQMKAQLDQQRQAGESEIQSALSAFTQQNQMASQAGAGFGESTTTAPTSGLTFGQNPNANQMAMTGQANFGSRPDDEFYNSAFA